MKDKQEPPKTVREMGIHMSYLQRDVSDIKDTLQKLLDGAVTRAEFADHLEWGKLLEKRLELLEDKRKLDEASAFTRIRVGFENNVTKFISWAIFLLFGALLAQVFLQQYKDTAPRVDIGEVREAR